MPKLSQSSGFQPLHDGTAQGLLASMQRAGIQLSATMPIATKPEQVSGINQWAASLDRGHFIPFGTIYPHSENAAEDLEEVKRLGLPGIKLHSNYQDFSPVDSFMLPLYQKARQLELIVLFHCGVDLSFPEPLATPQRIRSIVEEFPGLKIIASHMGGFQQWDEVEEFVVRTEVFLETSFTQDFLDKERFVRMIRAHGIKRVLFGSDSPWADQGHEVALLQASGLTAEELEAIFAGNARTLFKNEV